MDLQERLTATPREDVVLEEKKIKSYGNNYLAVKKVNRLKFGLIISLLFGFLFLTAVVLLVLVLCGV